MALTREFKETVMEQCKNPEFRKALLAEALETLLEGDIATANSLLKDYLNGCGAFEEISESTGLDVTNIRRALNPKSNPTIKKVMTIIGSCLSREQVSVSTQLIPH